LDSYIISCITLTSFEVSSPALTYFAAEEASSDSHGSYYQVQPVGSHIGVYGKDATSIVAYMVYLPDIWLQFS
jgi:hypothetical protein